MHLTLSLVLPCIAAAVATTPPGAAYRPQAPTSRLATSKQILQLSLLDHTQREGSSLLPLETIKDISRRFTDTPRVYGVIDSVVESFFTDTRHVAMQVYVRRTKQYFGASRQGLLLARDLVRGQVDRALSHGARDGHCRVDEQAQANMEYELKVLYELLKTANPRQETAQKRATRRHMLVITMTKVVLKRLVFESVCRLDRNMPLSGSHHSISSRVQHMYKATASAAKRRGIPMHVLHENPLRAHELDLPLHMKHFLVRQPPITFPLHS